MIAATELRLVVVTPETTLVDKVVKSLRFPLFDGQIGVLPNRAPLVGRLGVGELKIETAEGSESFFIEGGFAQVKGSIVTLLTSRAVAGEKIDTEAAEKELEAAQVMVPTTDEEFAAKQNMLTRSRGMLAIKKR
ncbi:UNVERIFIED_CONTAM: hypothetical protein GTU68_038393 [Idotea baltica]|nr:hypothetical protein [Idotea baltica]